jgi:hypothetical protein
VATDHLLIRLRTTIMEISHEQILIGYADQMVKMSDEDFEVIHECLRRWNTPYTMEEVPDLLHLHTEAWEIVQRVRASTCSSDPAGKPQ